MEREFLLFHHPLIQFSMQMGKMDAVLPNLKVVCLLLLVVWCGRLTAQDNELEPVDDTADLLGGILGGNAKGISKVKVISDTEQSISIEVDLKGFDDKHKIKGEILNKVKKPIKEIVSEVKVLPKSDGSVEVKFQFKQSSVNYTNSFLESNFLSLTISKSDGVLGDLDLGGENIFGTTYLYKLKKNWRVTGSESIVIVVKPIPFKSAASIQP